MSIRSFAKISLAVACILISVLPEARASTCSILEVHGANGKVGAGFGVQSAGVVPRSGGGDTGADGAEFQAGTNPNPVCGTVAKLPSKKVDIPTFVNNAVEAGLPSVYSNGSIPLTVFQVNRIGGGPMTCEYSADATGNSWQPMDMTLNMLGNFGIESQQNTKMSIVTTLRAGSRFTGGTTHDVGLIRCRAGTDGICGGCFAVQMSGQVMESSAQGASASPASSTLQLTSQQMSTVVSKVIALAQAQHLVASDP